MAVEDEHGNPTSGTTETVGRYDRAIDRLVRFSPEVVDIAMGLDAEHPDFAMGQALVAYLHLMSTDRPDVAVASAAADRLSTSAGNARERAHHAAISAWVNGDWHGSARILDDLLVEWPADLLALALGHELDFFLGDAANLRDRVGRSLHAFDPTHPHHGFVTGMFAFGLEESGHYGRSEAAGLAALDRNPDDIWAVHATAHTYEMQGLIDDGIRFMQGRVDDWGSGTLFSVHNWWHLGLYQLEAGAVDQVLDIYDSQIHHDESTPVSLELLDASAMLWRLHLDGVDVASRFDTLAKSWEAWDDGVPWYVFNDLHAVVALCGAGRIGDAREHLARLETDVVAGGVGSNVAMTAEVGLPASRAVVAFAEERYDDVVADTVSVRRIAHRFGGSHAQRDLILRTLTDAAIRAGEYDLGRSLLGERLSLRETSTYGMDRLAQVLLATGERDEADRVTAAADATRIRFAAAIAAPA